MKHFLTTLILATFTSVFFAQERIDTDSLAREIQQLKEANKREDYILRLTLLFVVSAGAVMLIFGTGYRNRKKAEAAQLAASKDRELAMQREQLYVNLTHELRTPLTLIIGPLEKLALEVPHPLLGTALQSARELEMRFNDILKWNKLEANAMSVLATTGLLEEEIKRTVDQFRSVAEEKGVRLHFHTEEEHWLELDFDKLKTILTNLIINALKFTGQGNEIWVETDFFETLRPPCFTLTVRDNGEDIPAELLPKIFERFTQSDDVQPQSFGSGIGLALAKGLAQLMGGEISASSSPGQGAVFTVRLPYAAADKKAEPAIPVFAGNNLREHLQLLLVEDSPELRGFIASSLSPKFEILQAAHSDEGLRFATEYLPDLIISDIMLPGNDDGIELCRHLKKNSLTCHIPVIMLTAKVNFEDKKAALEAGAEAYLTKPFSMQELELTLQSLLDNRQRLQEKFMRSLTFIPHGTPTMATDPFIEDALGHIAKNMDDVHFGVEELAKAMRISRVQLFKKIKNLTGMAPADLVRNIRLEKARQLLEEGKSNVSQVAYSTGFDNPNYFSKAFKKHFGISPSEVKPKLRD